MDHQGRILKALEGKITGFYLAGGTALTRYYFRHRESDDLDFFTQEFNPLEIFELIKEIEAFPAYTVEPVKEIEGKAVFYMVRSKGRDVQEIDFVRDFLRLKSKPNMINGIPVLSLEDIYIRKIYAAAGAIEMIGLNKKKRIEKTGRQEAKDFCDLYFLSHTSEPLSAFAAANCNQVVKEGLVRWFRACDKKATEKGLLELKMKKRVDAASMEKHFKQEIDKLIKKETSFI